MQMPERRRRRNVCTRAAAAEDRADETSLNPTLSRAAASSFTPDSFTHSQHDGCVFTTAAAVLPPSDGGCFCVYCRRGRCWSALGDTSSRGPRRSFLLHNSFTVWRKNKWNIYTSCPVLSYYILTADATLFILTMIISMLLFALFLHKRCADVFALKSCFCWVVVSCSLFCVAELEIPWFTKLKIDFCN